jgi:DNA damage-inducible protein 1
MKGVANQCGVSRLLDTRFSGIAKGVGIGTIVGKVHSVAIKIGKQFLPCSLTILEGDGPAVLLGLDMLKRHQVGRSFFGFYCQLTFEKVNINLKTEMLEINGEGIPFLSEHEIPKDN